MKAPKWRPTWHNKAIPWLFGHGEPMYPCLRAAWNSLRLAQEAPVLMAKLLKDFQASGQAV